MQCIDGVSVYSASDLVAFLGCKHRTTLDIRKLAGWKVAHAKDDEAAKLVQAYGNRHELSYLERLRERGHSVVEIGKKDDRPSQIAATREAMAAGTDVIFQATLLQPPFLGYADFLLKVPGPSRMGDYHYEVADTKLAKSNRAKFMVQLCLYADLVAAEQDVLPEYLHVVLGELDSHAKSMRGVPAKSENIAKLKTSDYIHYVRAIRQDFLDFVAAPAETQATPVSACGQCCWIDHCTAHWKETDHLSQVANIRKTQIAKLQSAGVTTMAELAEVSHPVLGIGVLPKLKAQADLQCHPTDAFEKLRIEFLPALQDKPRGFQLLPKPDAGDLYFDMEGFPYEPGGLEYLFGVGFADESKPGEFKFKAFWSHTRAEEKLAFESFMDFVAQHLSRHPDAHIYHYAAYEKSAIQRLSSLHDTRTEFRDRLLREGRLVDLYRVVSSGLLLAVPSYSIKAVESYYRPPRVGEVSNAGESIVQYEAFRVATDAADKSKLLADIEKYNFDDVESTWNLHQWLKRIKPADLAAFKAPVKDDVKNAERLARRTVREAREQAALAKLAAWVALQSTDEQPEAGRIAELVGQLLGFYWRCDLPRLWRKFDRLEKEESELLEDMECLAMLQLSERTQEAKSYRYHYTVPDQESKLFSGETVTCLTDDEPVGKFEYEPDACTVSVTRNTGRAAPPPLMTLCSDSFFDAGTKLDAIYGFVANLAEGTLASDAVFSLLGRKLPKLKKPGETVFDQSSVSAVSGYIGTMDGTHLVIQGPPGTGKTTLAAKVIAALVKDGKSVAVTSNSHSAINNLLGAAYKNTVDSGTAVNCVVVKPSEDLPKGIKVLARSEDLDSSVHKLAGGTAWLFGRAAQTAQWDYLFVDEASQVSLADTVAAGGCARNIVLLGDQMQLPQPVEGIHPGDSGVSALDYLMQGQATVPSTQGVFLGLTYRMHPDVCRPISEGVYEGRLQSAEHCGIQRLQLQPGADSALKETGIVYVPVSHEHCSQSSPKEVNRIDDIYKSLLRQSWTTRDGSTKQLTAEDILLVAPYRAQVRELRRKLGDTARVGTVDKFQGQEAAVVIFSMTASDVEEIPRGLDFLFSKNRLNVAISRAKCLAIVVASPELRTISCGKIEEMPLLNFYATLTQSFNDRLS